MFYANNFDGAIISPVKVVPHKVTQVNVNIDYDPYTKQVWKYGKTGSVGVKYKKVISAFHSFILPYSHISLRLVSNELLLGLYEHSSRLFQLADRLTLSKPQHILLKNLQGSSPAFIISAIFRLPASSQLNHVVVCEDAETAAYFHNSLENLTKALDIFYFPSSFKNNKTYQELNSSHVMLRTEALTRGVQGAIKRLLSLILRHSLKKWFFPKRWQAI